jgi:hypothetical protein
VELDGTLALSERSQDRRQIGPPVPLMLKRVRYWIKTGRTVKIFTARAGDPLDVLAIHHWCVRHGLPKLEVTDRKDIAMIALWDDRAVGVLRNIGVPLLPASITWWQSLRLRVSMLFRRRPVMKLDREKFQGHFPLAQQAPRSFFEFED